MKAILFVFVFVEKRFKISSNATTPTGRNGRRKQGTAKRGLISHDLSIYRADAVYFP